MRVDTGEMHEAAAQRTGGLVCSRHYANRP